MTRVTDLMTETEAARWNALRTEYCAGATKVTRMRQIMAEMREMRAVITGIRSTYANGVTSTEPDNIDWTRAEVRA